MVGRRRGILPPEPLREAAILEEAGFVGIWDTDARVDRVRCSPACARLYGLHPDDGLHGVPLDRFIRGCHPDDRRALAEAVTAATRTRPGCSRPSTGPSPMTGASTGCWRGGA